jgi:hypothetical protein
MTISIKYYNFDQIPLLNKLFLFHTKPVRLKNNIYNRISIQTHKYTWNRIKGRRKYNNSQRIAPKNLAQIRIYL